MSRIMRAGKALNLAVLHLACLLTGLVIAVPFLASRDRKARARARGMMIWARCACWILGIRIHRTGSCPPVKGIFVVSNHSSYLDIIVLGSLFPAVFLAKKEVGSWPLIGWLARLAGTRFVVRESRKSTADALENIKQLLDSGMNVIVFPEATTNDGTMVRDFRSSLFKAPVDMKVPVLPVSVMYSHVNSIAMTPEMLDSVAWYGEMDLIPHLWDVLGLKRIDVRVHRGPVIREVLAEDSSKTRKILAAFAHSEVMTGFESLRLEISSSQGRQKCTIN